MSDVNDALLVWRRELERTGDMSSDDVTELESHLLQEMDSLQRAGLQPDEAFVIASRRLGHPYELATEYAKNDTLLSWRRPARLVLWGLLLLDAITLCWSVVLLVTSYFELGDLLGYTFRITQVGNWVTLFLFWKLAANSQGLVPRALAKVEAVVQTYRGAILLVAGVTLAVPLAAAIRLYGWWYRTQELARAGTPIQMDNFGSSMIMQLILNQSTWTVPVVVLLVILVRLERPYQVAKLATR